MEFAERARLAGLELLPGRIVLASSMIAHGRDKATAEGAKQSGEFFAKLGFHPGHAWARATGLTELGAGVLTLLGIGTRIAALGILVTQAVAVAKVHLPKGFQSTKGGFEFNAALMATALGMLIVGPGKVSAYEATQTLAERRRRRAFLRRRRTRAHKLLRLLK